MSDYEFSKKPRRMTSPPQNQRKWLGGYEGVEVIMETDPARIAYFAREATWGDLMMEPNEEEMADTLKEVAGGKVLSAAFKGGIGFRITASRATMDQALRLAEGGGGAGSGAGAQTTRDNDCRNFNIIVPNTIEELRWIDNGMAPIGMKAVIENMLYQRVRELVNMQREVYGQLIDAGVPPQDARYVALPLGFQTQWTWIVSLGNLIKLCEQRLCNGLAQHETNYLIRVMRDLVVAEHPWMDKNLRSSCEKRGECASKTMLFPPCGAFISEDDSVGLTQEEAWLEVTQYKPDRHLYQSEANDAMQFAWWDIDRQKLERENPDVIYCMAGPPEPLR